MKAKNLSNGKTKNQAVDEELTNAHDKIEGVKIDAMRQNFRMPKA